jgi:hypothetical protein
VYRPTIIIDIRIIVTALFVRPHYHHYYFGDYYAANYAQGGIYPWFAFHNSRLGYDPLFAHASSVYGQRDPQWASQLRESYLYRREHEAARPPRTFRAYGEWNRRLRGDRADELALAQPITVAARNRDFPVQLERVDERRVEVIKKNVTQIRQFRDQRARLERQVADELPRAKDDAKGAKQPRRKTPARVKMPEAPKLGPAATTGKGPGTVAPPEGLRPPAPGPKDPPTPAPGGKRRPLPDPEDNLRPRPGDDRPRPKGPIDPVLPGGGKDPRLPPRKGKERPLDPGDRPKIDPDRPRPPVKDPDIKDRPKLDPPDRPPVKDRPKLDPPDRPPVKDRPKLDPPERPKLPPKLDPPPKKGPVVPPPQKDRPGKKDKDDKDG